MKKLIILLAVVFLTAMACKQESKKGGAAQMGKVMAVHDSLMPEMNTLTKLVAQLNEKADTTETGMKYEAAKKDLQAAHKAMMDWMQDFGTKFDHKEILEGKELSQEKKDLLKEEEQEVNALKEQIHTSINNAKKLLTDNK